MKRRYFLAAVLIMTIGCTSPDNRNSTTNKSAKNIGPWASISDEDDYGGINSTVTFQSEGEDVIEYDVQVAHFGDLLQDIGEMTDCSVKCTDNSLIDKGVTVKFSGAGAQALLNDLGSKLNLTVHGTAPSFTLSPVDDNPN